MRLVVGKEALVNAVATVKRAAIQSVLFPNQIYMVLDAGKDYLKLRATNAQFEYEQVIPAEVEEEGTIGINAERFNQYVSKLTAGKVEMQVTDNRLFIKAGKSKSEFATVDSTLVNELLPGVDEKDCIELSCNFEQLQLILARTVWATNKKDDMGVITNSVWLSYNPEDNVLTAAGTDRYKIADDFTKVTSSTEPFELLINAQPVYDLLRIKCDDDVSIKVKPEHYVVISFGDLIFRARLSYGNYPLYQKLFELNEATKISLNKQELVEVLTRCLMVPNSTDLKVRAKDNKLTFVNKTKEYSVEEEIEISGSEVEFWVNVRYLLDAITNFQSEAVDLLVDDKIVIMGGEDNLRVLINPLNIGGE